MDLVSREIFLVCFQKRPAMQESLHCLLVLTRGQHPFLQNFSQESGDTGFAAAGFDASPASNIFLEHDCYIAHDTGFL
jgi:hypothetical protein